LYWEIKLKILKISRETKLKLIKIEHGPTCRQTGNTDYKDQSG